MPPESEEEQAPFRWGSTKATVRKRGLPSQKLGQEVAQKEKGLFSLDNQSIGRPAKESAVAVPTQAVASSISKSSGGLATPQASPAAVEPNPGANQNGIAFHQRPERSRAGEERSGISGREAHGNAAVQKPAASNGKAIQSSHSPTKAAPSWSQQTASNAETSNPLGKRSAPESEAEPGKYPSSDSGSNALVP